VPKQARQIPNGLRKLRFALPVPLHGVHRTFGRRSFEFGIYSCPLWPLAAENQIRVPPSQDWEQNHDQASYPEDKNYAQSLLDISMNLGVFGRITVECALYPRNPPRRCRRYDSYHSAEHNYPKQSYDHL
jgi:hypothetical protein